MKKGYCSPEARAKLKSLGALGKSAETNLAMCSLLYDMPFAESSSPPAVLKRITLVSAAVECLCRAEIEAPSKFSAEIASALKEVEAKLNEMARKHERAAKRMAGGEGPATQ